MAVGNQLRAHLLVSLPGQPYPQRDCGRVSAWIAVDSWHGWGALKDSS